MIRWLKSNHQALTATGAMLVAIAALYVAWDQSRVMRSQEAAQVWPALQADNFSILSENQLRIGFQVRNAGVGPAMVRQVALTRDDGLVADTQDVFIAQFPGTLGYGNETLTGRILAAGDDSHVLTLVWDADTLSDEERQAIAVELNRWSLRACYCSVHDDCWEAVSMSYAQPEPVRRCEIPEARRF